MTYLKEVLNQKKTPQTEPIPGTAQVANSAGGYAFAVDDWTRLNRFLILGSEGGSYYAAERALTAENAQAVLRCIAADGLRTVREIVTVSDAGRAPKNDPAIFALALAASHGDAETRKAALDAGVQVRGVLGELKRLVAAMILDPPGALIALETIVASGSRLPHDEVEAAQRRWSRMIARGRGPG